MDARAKATGQAVYVEDLPDLPGTVYGVNVRSAYAHARLRGIDSSAAEALPGVLGAIHQGNLAGLALNLELPNHDQVFFAVGKARYDGDPIGMVAALDRLTAERAAQAVAVDYEPLPTLFSAEEALAPGAPLIHDHLGSNLALDELLEWGNVDRGFAEADHAFQETYVSGNVSHHQMEPATSFLVNFGPELLEVWLPTNTSFWLADQASKMFNIPLDRIRVRVPYVGGNFGGKDTCVEALVAAALSRKVGRPIRVVASEAETFRACSRHAITWKARIGVTSDGTLTAMDVDLTIDTGAYYTAAGIATRNALTAAFGAYRVPHLRVRALTSYTNKTPSGTFRNTGKSQTTFGSDCAIDNIARQLGLDPIEVRYKNVYRLGETVGPAMWQLSGGEVAAPKPLDSDVPELMRSAIEALGWDKAPKPEPSPDGRFVHGRGIAISLRRGSASGLAEALASLDESGTVLISHNAPEVGGGQYTMISVVAADTLGVPRSQVRVGEPDSSNNLRFHGVSSQRTTVQMGTAVQAACEDLCRLLAQAAAEAKGGRPEDWRVDQGRVFRGAESCSFADIAVVAGRTLTGRGVYPRKQSTDRFHLDRDPRAPGAALELATDEETGATRIMPHDHWAPGVGALDIRLDRETGEVHVLRYVCLADAGKVLHYNSAQGQVHGGAVMGLSIALFEDMRHEEGQLLNGDAFQYRLATLRDVPEDLKVIFEEHGDGPGPFGSKAVAQVSISTAAPAISNAIYDAVGVRLRATPFTPEKILREMGALTAL